MTSSTPRNPVGWFEIYVDDMPRAKAFYESVFQLKLDRLDTPDLEMWAFPMEMDRAGAGGALVKMPGGPSGGGCNVIIYFSCENCAVEAARVAKAGGRVDKEKFSIGQYGFIALVYDTEGNMIGLHSLK
ncbi:MAG TPA: VOC family protein [Dongiaceae bacterium]|nr:VOC family protein [Dongiaceae bacterium]